MFRKEEDAVADWSEDTVAMCAQRQKTILAAAAEMLKPGGRLVYSTCTFSPEENEGVIADFLASRRDFELIRIEGFAPGRPEWADGNPELTKCARLWPHLLSGEGHFAALLRRTDGEAGSVELEHGKRFRSRRMNSCLRRWRGSAWPSARRNIFCRRTVRLCVV